MKMNKTATTISIGIAALLIPLSVFAAGTAVPTAIGYGSLNISSGVSGNFSLGSNGTAMSYAHNREAATATVGATTSFTPSSGTVTVGVSGQTATSSDGQAYNISTGSGAGMADSHGSAATLVIGATAIQGAATGLNSGWSGTQTNNAILAGTNQGSYVLGQTASGFEAGMTYVQPATINIPVAGIGNNQSTTVSISSSNMGFANGKNASGALAGMNAAGIANIGSTGQFFGQGGLSAIVGPVIAP